MCWLEDIQARAETIYFEMIGSGVDDHVAARASSALANFPNAPGHGLGCMDDQMLAGKARLAIDAYLAKMV